jgi:hypothetical protein
MPDYSKMFQAPRAVVGQTTTLMDRIHEVLNWRKDLSDKVIEHVDLVTTVVKKDINPLDQANASLEDLMRQVGEFAEKDQSLVLRMLGNRPDSMQIRNTAARVFEQINKLLIGGKKVDPFLQREATQVLEQATYLGDQLYKVCKELDVKKLSVTDELEQDAYNKRIATLNSQYLLVADGLKQIQQLAMDIQTRPVDIDAFLSSTLPQVKKMCFDVIDGTVKVSELRKQK